MGQNPHDYVPTHPMDHCNNFCQTGFLLYKKRLRAEDGVVGLFCWLYLDTTHHYSKISIWQNAMHCLLKNLSAFKKY